ncbi:hypothetical protein Y032_0048g1599 [Ancylostoma ceylanicum]|uniref:SCP domain-containing protein n=1 Tax=Ancylostoma ceylanicum TaxID=53326 RepID=A0A016UAB3_9BILA|nr:hypothetical protein Y032_0048g1599 [Ancylostoma ceylanicum]
MYISKIIANALAFGCKNTLIADDWREMVLKFHNDKRRLLSKGSVTSKDGNVAPWGTNINELVRNCIIFQTFAGLERHVTCARISKMGGLRVPFSTRMTAVALP